MHVTTYFIIAVIILVVFLLSATVNVTPTKPAMPRARALYVPSFNILFPLFYKTKILLYNKYNSIPKKSHKDIVFSISY